MKKVTTMLNSPAKIAGFAACIIILVAAIFFATVQAGANINENKTIGMDKGVNIALDDAGIKLADAANLTSHYDTEDGNAVYEVSFTAGGYEYDYVIKAADGKILEADREAAKSASPTNSDKNDSNKSAPSTNSSASSDDAASKPSDKKESTSSSASTLQPSSSYIGVDKAKSIALKDAGLSASSVTFTKAKLDRDDGLRVYEIEFFTSSKEYEYEINAATGKIIDKDIDVNDDFEDDDDDDDEWDD